MNLHYKKVTPLAVTLIAFGSLVGGVNATVLISDSTFNDADWTVTETIVSGGVVRSEGQVATGGNPGAYRGYTHDFSGGAGDVDLFHGFTGQTYTPSIQGAILSVDYSEDSISLDGLLIGAGAGLMQDGVVYSYSGTSLNFTSASWFTQTRTGLVESDFKNNGNSPDFSNTGSEITFGFRRWNSTGGNGVFNAGIDNWSFEITAVPEPSTTLLAGLMAVAAVLASRRRKSNNALE